MTPNDQATETLYLSSVTLAELLFGIGALPAGKRKDMMAQTLDGLMGLFRDRVLPCCGPESGRLATRMP